MAKLTKDELRAELDARGVAYNEDDTNADLERKLREHNEQQGHGAEQVDVETVEYHDQPDAGVTPADQPGPTSTSDAVSAAEAANEQVQEQVDKENEKGYRGFAPDPTPLENYTLQGQTEGKPTPETDVDLAQEVGSKKFEEEPDATNLPDHGFNQ